MENYFDDSLLETFAETFYGYGNYNGHYWLIGMEEGGGDLFDNVEKRLSACNKRGRQELEDVAEFHRAIDLGELFDEKPTRQPTWDKLTRILLSAEGLLSTESQDEQRKQIREYRQTSLGKISGGENCLIELFPLPSPSIKHWMYEHHSELMQLKSRERYIEHYKSRRVKHIRARIDQYRPRVVVFYGTTYLHFWEEIVTNTTCPFDKTSKPYIAQQNGTLFIVIDHPASRWANKYFDNIGQRISSDLAMSHAELGSSVEARN